ncbi:hypothetical protein ACFGVR_15480 [Mucilaginibacter sp. AW1-3]
MKKILMSYCCPLIVAACCSIRTIHGQGLTEPELYRLTQPAPNAASLGKYGEYPVSLYTGVPNINIPLYELTAGRIKIPLRLSYHAGGIKVEEIASSVGLGWSLNAGGVITRTVMGLPDENYYLGDQTFLTANLKVDGLLAQMSDPNQALNNYNYLKKIIDGKVDGEPDVFYFNFGDMAGKFMYHQEDHKFYSVPYSKLKIEFSGGPGNSSFVITDEKGIQYTFAAPEISYRSSATNTVVQVTTSWYLSEIYDPVTKQGMSFGYEDYTLQYETLGYEAYYYAPQHQDVTVNPKQDINHNVKRLKIINWNNSTVLFDYQKPRCDLPGDFALTSMRIYDNTNKLLKSWDLNYDYFYDNGFMPSNCNSHEESVFQRLKLVSVKEKPAAGSTLPSKPYIFEYNIGGNLPSRYSKAQDHWGYYNGQFQNQHLYPPYTISTNPLIIVPGGNRNIVPGVALAGSLSRIIYPTGGHTDFLFENNTAFSSNLPPLQTGNQIGAGAPDQNNRYVEVPFTVSSSSLCTPNPANGVTMTLTVSGLDEDLLHSTFNGGLALTVSYINTDTNQGDMLFQYGGSKNVGRLDVPLNFVLPNGNYKLIYDCTQNPIPDSYESASANLSWTTCDPDTSGTRYVGGLRIKKIVNYKDETSVAMIKSYRYHQENYPSRSSGQTQFNPSYVDQVMFSQSDQGNIGEVPVYTKLHSNSNYPLVSENGKAVGYSTVIELNGEDDTNGYTQYQYTNFDEHPDNYNGSYSNSLPISYQWLRGLELGKKVFKKQNGQLKLLSETINEYDTGLLGANKKTFNGIRGIFISASTDLPLELPGDDMLFISEAAPGWENHPTYADFVHLARTTERYHTDDNHVIENIKDFTYDSKNLLPSITTTSASNGDKLIAHTLYSVDYNVNNAVVPKALAIKQLQDLNMVTTPIEQYTEKQTGNGDKRLTAAIFNSYKADQPLIDTIFYQNTPAVQPLNYSPVMISSTAFSKSTNYRPDVIIEKYDTDSNLLLQQKKANGPSNSYQWGYGETLLIAECKNASNTEFYTQNYEEPGSGGIAGTAHTGNQLGTNAEIVWVRPNSRAYLIDYWYLDGTTWKYKQDNYTTNSYAMMGGSAYDDVRIYPADAQITTYTYQPLVGMTSSIDARGMTTYYEYDSFQRLINVRDKDGNILKHTDYHYQNQ